MTFRFKDGALESCSLRLVGNSGPVSDINNADTGVFLVTDDGRLIEGVDEIRIESNREGFTSVRITFSDIPIEIARDLNPVRKIRIQNDQVNCDHIHCVKDTDQNSPKVVFRCLNCGLTFTTRLENPNYVPEPRDWDEDDMDIPF